MHSEVLPCFQVSLAMTSHLQDYSVSLTVVLQLLIQVFQLFFACRMLCHHSFVNQSSNTSKSSNCHEKQLMLVSLKSSLQTTCLQIGHELSAKLAYSYGIRISSLQSASDSGLSSKSKRKEFFFILRQQGFITQLESIVV